MVIQQSLIRSLLISGLFVVFRKVSGYMTTEKEIEQKIQEKGLNAPRLTPDYIDSKIKAVRFVGGDVDPDYFSEDYKMIVVQIA